jgi:hypothetical protein
VTDADAVTDNSRETTIGVDDGAVLDVGIPPTSALRVA